MKKTTSFFLSCLKAWRGVFVFAAACAAVPFVASAATGARPAAGAPASVSVSSETGASSIRLTYSFPMPTVKKGPDGLSSVTIRGLNSFGAVGAPELPALQVSAAIPAGKQVKSVKFVPGELSLFATGVSVRHAQRPRPASAKGAAVPAPRDEAIYASANPYPASPLGKGETQWKRGVGLYVVSLRPVVYVPASGELSWYETGTVEIELESEKPIVSTMSSAPTVRTRRMGARSGTDLGAVSALVDNPADVSSYPGKATRSARVRAKLQDEGEGNGDAPIIFKSPILPCGEDEEFPGGFKHVIVTTSELLPSFAALARYRRSMGTSSTVVTVEDIESTYIGADTQERIREFIIDAYENWGTEYVVLGGDTDIVPARMLWVEAWAGGDVDTMPSDLYYQCLDFDFDGNGNGVFGEPGDNVDLFAEVYVGRVSAETPEEVANWLAKVKKYDADCMAKADYTRGVLFAGEYMGPLDNTYGKPLMEQIRLGTQYTGSNGGFITAGFADAPDLFDEDKMQTLYAADSEWAAADMMEIFNSQTVSVINHMGHSDYNYNMLMDNTQADALVNECPVFVYSQGCIAGAMDKDCIAEHFTTSTKNGCFGGVWNARYGWYSYSAAGPSPSGPSQCYHRWFWDAVFSKEFFELGVANAFSHENNAAAINEDCMRWCYYETNLFGDPIQTICGPRSSIEFDRDAYKSSATAGISYTAAGLDTNMVDAVLYLIPSNSTDAVTLCDVTLYLAENGEDDAQVYTNSVSLPEQSGEYRGAERRVQHGDTIRIELADGSRWDIADIDDVPPQIFGIVLRNPDEDLVTAAWETDEPADSSFQLGSAIPLAADAPVVVDVNYRLSHSAQIDGLEPSIYFARIVAADRAGNTNAVPFDALCADPDEYPQVIVATRQARAAFDMENDASAWTVSPASSATYTNCWELGTPTYGPECASRCWGTVIGGRYLSGANDSLVSPPVSLSSCPTISFRQWYDIEETPLGASNLAAADYGIVEVMVLGSGDSYAEEGVVDGAWHNVMQYARVSRDELVSGSSNGLWEDVRILLPAEYDGKTVRVRFRFVSDTYAGGRANPAGWYIDTVSFKDVPEGGVSLAVVEIDDAEGGNGDGFVQPGETIKVKLASANISFDTLVVPVGGGSVVVSAGGDGTGMATLSAGSPAPISYPALEPGVVTPADDFIVVKIDENIPFGTPITLVQTLRGESGVKYDSSVVIRVANPSSLTGKVLQPTGNPVVGALVSVNTSDADYVFTTGEDGAFSFDAIPAGRKVRVVAAYGYASASCVVETPASDVVVTLPLAEIGVSEDEFEFTVTLDGSPVTGSFSITNFFTLAALDGNEGPSADLDYVISGFKDDFGLPLPWFRLATPEKGSVAPQGEVVVSFEIDPAQITSTTKQTFTLFIESNAWNEELVPVKFTVNVEVSPELVADGAEAIDEYNIFDIWDVIDDLPDANNDYDGYLECGELGSVWFFLANPSDNVAVDSFVGTVEVLSGNAEIFGDNSVSWGLVYPGYSLASDNDVIVMWNAQYGETVTFRVTGTATCEGGSREMSFDFDIVTPACDFALGKFLKENLFPAQPVGATNPVGRARVFATGEDGDVHVGTYTSVDDGIFFLDGLLTNKMYWISYSLAPSDHGTVPPPAFLSLPESRGENVPPNGRHFNLEIVGTSYGTNSVPHFVLSDVSLGDEDGDGLADYGELLNLAVTLKNDGVGSSGKLRAELTLPDFEHAPCMDLVEGAGASFEGTIEAGQSCVVTGLAVRVQSPSETCFDGAFQRFILTVTEDLGTENDKVWYFDFVVEVRPAFSVSGAIGPDGAPVKGVVVTLDNGDPAATRTSVVTNETGIAEYAFEGVAPGDYTVSISGLPKGYVCAEPSKAVTIAGADVTDVDFEIGLWGVDGVVSDYYDPESGCMDIEISEGESLEVPFAIANIGSVADDLAVEISYVRKAADVLSRDQVESEVSMARTSLSKSLGGGNWSRLDSSLFNPGELEVLFKEGTPVAARDAYLARHGFRASYHFRSFPGSIAVPASGVAAASQAAASLADARSFTASAADDAIVVSVQPSVVCHQLQAVPADADPLYEQQWALDNRRQTGGTKGADIGAEEAWDFANTTGSSDIHVAVTDTGIHYRHPDLAGNWTGLGWNYVDMYDNYTPGDDNGHGTHVAGIIGAVGGNGLGIRGVNWHVGLVSSRICAPDGFGGEAWASSAQIARAFEESYLDFGCCVNNNSWGSVLYSEFIHQAMRKAQDYGMLFVVAAGNDGLDVDITETYPACLSKMLDNVIVVAAADHDDNIAFFSNYGPKLVHLAAPGYNILSTYIDTSRTSSEGVAPAAGENTAGNYVLMSGTSMASPYVAGAAAFLKAVSPAATYGVIKDALLNGVRKDPDLADKVSTSGHLDLATAVRLLGRNWLRFCPAETVVLSTNVTLAAGASVSLPLLVNTPPELLAGEYEAVIKIAGNEAAREIPVHLTVDPAGVAKLKSVEVTAEEMPDGRAVVGEKVSLSIVVDNAGTAEFEELSAELVPVNGGEVLSGTWPSDYLSGRESSKPGVFEVVLPNGVDTAEFTLVLKDGGEVVAELPVSLPLFDGTVLKVTVADGSAPVEGAVAELVGGAGATAFTDAAGVAYLPVPTSATGDLTLRVIADGCVRYVEKGVPSSGEKSVALSHASVAVSETVVNLEVSEGKSLEKVLSLSSADGVAAALKLAPQAKVAVFDDGDDSAVLVDSLRGMGFAVDYFPGNYKIVTITDGATLTGEIVHTVVYSWDDALVLGYDAVISVLSGTDGSGRLLGASEGAAFKKFVERGGRLVFTGASPLSLPDNLGLAELMGLSEDACDVVVADGLEARVADQPFIGQPFVELADGDAFPASAGEYDAVLDSNVIGNGSSVAVVGSEAGDVSKIYLSERSAQGGVAMLWDGNVSDWSHEGASLDLLRNFLYDEFIAAGGVSWLKASADSFGSLGSASVTLAVNEDLALGVGDYSATVLVFADVNGEECVPVTVNLKVLPPVVRAHNASGTVTDFGGRPLKGDGGLESGLLQVIYAGPDGKIDPPAADGSATGDDVILLASGTGVPCAYFGCGSNIPADAGRFDAEFNLSFASYDAEAENLLYARAWDAPSAASATAYGDSELKPVAYTDGQPDAIDFGSWVVDTAFCDALEDSNGDTIPDAWIIKYRPDLDPRAPVEPLDTEVSMSLDDCFDTAVAPTTYNAEGNPARVFVSGDYVYVLEQYTHRIVVHDRAAPYAIVATYGRNGGDGSFGSGDGEFNQPFGMALDTVSGKNRFAVADTGNNRVQLFEFDGPSITFKASYGTKTSVSEFGSTSADTKTLLGPRAVAFAKGGYLLVADTGNFRVLRLQVESASLSFNASYAFDNKSSLQGLCYDKDNVAGFWVADAGPSKQCISFHHMAGFTKEPVVSFGTSSSKDFAAPRDVQVWTVGSRKRICAVDYEGSRLRIFDCQQSAKGAYTGISFVADIGAASDASLQPYQKLWKPNGVFPVDGSNLVYVADYGHNQVKWYGLTLDGDQDGMDDFWEDMNGLDSTVDDAMDDADGDGLSNVGEFRAGTNPKNADSDGDGVGDLTEMYNLRDPLDAAEEAFTVNEVVEIAALDTDGAAATTFLVGTNVTVKVVFANPVEGDCQVILYNAAGDCIVDAPMVVSGSEATYSYVPAEKDVGLVDACFIFAECDPPTLSTNALFEVVSGGDDPEVTEEVPWIISSIALDDSGEPSVVLAWDFPSEAVPAEGKCVFRLDFATVLDGSWDSVTLPQVEAESAADCTATIPLSVVGTPSQCFFRLWWTNKVKDAE